jgi:hypothetical protein
MSETKVTIDTKKKEITIVMPLTTPRPSKSGKNCTIATTSGNLKTGINHEGKPVTIGVNVYVPNE